MNRNKKLQAIGWVLLVACAVSLSSFGQDQGFDIIYEGFADEESDTPQASFDMSLYGTAGFTAASAFWASGGARVTFSVDAFEIHVDGSVGTDGITVQGGAATEILGFGVAGDVTWSPGSQPTIDLRGWGTLDVFRLTANVLLAGKNTAVSLSGSTEFDGYGLSANIGLSGAGLTQASIGANMQLGEASISGSAGLSSGRFNVGGGIGLRLGPVNVTASAGYDGAIGLNAMLGGGLGWEGLQVTTIALYDNTGVGLEASGEIDLGNLTATFMGRFSLGSMTFEVGGRVPLGAIVVSASVALDNANGLSWAEAGFEWPL